MVYNVLNSAYVPVSVPQQLAGETMTLLRRQVYRTFFSASALDSAERRWVRQMVKNLTNPRIQALWAEVAFWLLLIASIAMGYLWSSFECAMGRDCFIASADLANWFFGK